MISKYSYRNHYHNFSSWPIMPVSINHKNWGINKWISKTIICDWWIPFLRNWFLLKTLYFESFHQRTCHQIRKKKIIFQFSLLAFSFNEVANSGTEFFENIYHDESPINSFGFCLIGHSSKTFMSTLKRQQIQRYLNCWYFLSFRMTPNRFVTCANSH